MLLEPADIFDFLRGLPVGLIAAAAFLVLTFFVVLLWLEVAALNHALRKRSSGINPSEVLQRMCADLDRIEGELARLNNCLEALSAENKQKKNGDG